MLRKAGIKVKRTLIPNATYWNDWTKYPFSITNWNGRPLGVQVYALAYRSGEDWNEFGWSNPKFDALLKTALETADIEKRKGMMAKLEKMIQDDGVTIQPYWRTLTNSSKATLGGCEQHISYDVRPADVYWKS